MKKAVVLLSGGQDSATCLAWALEEFEEVQAITFDYGQRHKREVYSANSLCALAGCELTPITVASAFRECFGGYTDLTPGSEKKSHAPKGYPATWIPGRNMILLSLAGGFACVRGIHNLVIGVSQVDYSGYPDCRQQTILTIEHAISKSLDFPFKIETPLIWRRKAEIIRLMEGLGHLDWYKHTWTCYKGGSQPCGLCQACILRAKGFREVGIPDPALE